MLSYREKLAALLLDWDESQHPRDDSGRFAESEGGDGANEFAPVASTREVPDRPDLGTTRPKPIHAKTLGEAVDLMLKGEVVELDDIGTVHTVLTKLAQMAEDAKAKGEQAPNYDLCKVSVGGQNLFCGSTLRTKAYPHGIPRIRMPQLTGQPIPGTPAADAPQRKPGSVDASAYFLKELQADGIRVREERVAANSLKASQAELVGPTVAGMMTAQRDLGKDPIFVSRDNYILDGHHRWAALVGRDAADGRLGDSRMNIRRVDAPISELLHRAKTFAKKFGIKAKAGKTLLATIFDGTLVLGDTLGHPFRGNQWTDVASRGPDVGSGGGATFRAGMRPASKADAERIKALKLPPAWTHVHLSEDPKADLQAVGTDAAGRTQYRYSAAHTERAAAEKFARLKEFHAALPDLRTQIAEDMRDRSLSEEERESAVMLHVIDQTAFRPGSDSDTGADKFAYGVTTLEGRHVKVDGDKVRFRFRGKDGVLNAKTITNPALAHEFKDRLTRTGPHEPLFPTATDAHLRDYLHARDGDFKPKDLRTWHGTNTALKTIAKMKAPTTEKEFKKAQRVVAKAVAGWLGNTPAVALKSYIDPAVWSKWKAKL